MNTFLIEDYNLFSFIQQTAKVIEINHNAKIDALNSDSKLEFQFKHHNISWLENADFEWISIK